MVTWRLKPLRLSGDWPHALCISLETEDLTVTWQLNHPPITCRETKNRRFLQVDLWAPVLFPTVTWNLVTPIIAPPTHTFPEIFTVTDQVPRSPSRTAPSLQFQKRLPFVTAKTD